MGKKITIFLFLITIFGLSAVTFVAKDREFSEMENRILASKPEVTLENIASGEFAEDLETYLSDQMFLKDYFVMLKNESDLLSGKDKLGEVYFAEGRYIRNFVENEEQVKKNLTFINKWIETNDIDKEKVSFVLIPTASYVYNDLLPEGNLSDSEENTFKLVEEEFSSQVISLKDVYKDSKEEDIYFKTDHHWTMYGAYLAYVDIMHTVGQAATPLYSFEKIEPKEEFYGSLHSQAPLLSAKGEKITFYDYADLDYTVTYETKEGTYKSFLIEENFSVKDKYTALFDGNHGRITIKNNLNTEAKKLIIFKDSYSNSLIPFLIANYSEIEVIDLRYSSFRPGYYSDKTDYDVMFIYNTDFINTDNSFAKLLNF